MYQIVNRNFCFGCFQKFFRSSTFSNKIKKYVPISLNSIHSLKCGLLKSQCVNDASFIMLRDLGCSPVVFIFIFCPQVAEQLFKPLVFQLIHWFTNNKKYESPETMALLDGILVRSGQFVLLLYHNSQSMASKNKQKLIFSCNILGEPRLFLQSSFRCKGYLYSSEIKLCFQSEGQRKLFNLRLI